MSKIDFSLVAEIVGATLVATGLAMVSVPLSLIVSGSFLVWITEKVN
jgi:hypothetical protein